jgi:hypothetical protein
MALKIFSKKLQGALQRFHSAWSERAKSFARTQKMGMKFQDV